jgi:hypothetical protein
VQAARFPWGTLMTEVKSPCHLSVDRTDAIIAQACRMHSDYLRMLYLRLMSSLTRRLCDARVNNKPGLVVAVLVLIAVTSSFAVCAQDLPAQLAKDLQASQPSARVITSTVASPATDPAAAVQRAASRIGENRRLFFGFLEFDWNPNAPGGVPGFSPLPDPAQIANR